VGFPAADRIGALPEHLCRTQTFDLLADQHLVVGHVVIANDDDMLYVSFHTTGGWEMVESHLAVTASPDLIPRQGKRIAPGKFTDKSHHRPPAIEAHYAVPLSVLGASRTAVVAAHADIQNGVQEEGAWIDGAELREGGSWASYASYEVGSCATASIGGGGGEIVGDGVTLTIPAGALNTTEEIAIHPVPSASLPEGALPGTAFDFEPDGLMFAEPGVRIVIEYDDTGLSLAQEEALAIWLLNDGVWEKVP
jgi:hypothetical protein